MATTKQGFKDIYTTKDFIIQNTINRTQSSHTPHHTPVSIYVKASQNYMSHSSIIHLCTLHYVSSIAYKLHNTLV